MQRRIVFTEDRKDHKDKSFNIKANAPEPPLHKPNAGSASDQDSAEVVEAFEIWMRQPGNFTSQSAREISRLWSR
jgi:hypothetical protein